MWMEKRHFRFSFLYWPGICSLALILGVSQAAAFSWDPLSLARKPIFGRRWDDTSEWGRPAGAGGG
jgi:hypothetical protein